MVVSLEEKKIRIIFRRGSLGLKLVVLAMVVLTLAVLLITWLLHQDAKTEYEALRQTAVALEQENDRLEERLEIMNTVQGVIEIAVEELGLVLPDTIIIEPEQ